jgi:sugar/nucleoside kinase (ribokinase family)
MRKLLLLCTSLAVMFMYAGVSFAGDATTVKGYVTDSKCGAKGKTNAECAKKCLEKGAKVVVVTDGNDKVLTVDNPDAVTEHVGHHVAVTGQVSGDSIHVDSVKML